MSALNHSRFLILRQNLIPIILFRPLLLFVPQKTAQQIRILLLKGTHAPLIGAIWLFERWEVFALRREAIEKAALSFGFDTFTARNNQGQPLLTEANTVNKPSSKKHTLKMPKKLKVPAALLSKASKRTSKQAGTNQDGRGRVNTAPAVVEENPTPGNVAGPEPAVPVPQSAVSAPGEATSATGTLPASDVATMMRMLKELSTQVEEVRASLVKHDSGAIE